MLIDDAHGPEGLKQALKHIDTDLRFNIRSQLCEYYLGRWIPANDRNSMKIKYKIRDKCTTLKNVAQRVVEVPLDISKQKFYECRDALLCDIEVDPFRDYLESLEPLELKIEDVESYNLSSDRCLEGLFSVEPSHYHRHCFRSVLLTAVWRAFEPGYKVDEICVLQGPQGAGKDSVLREILPDEKYFTDALSFSSSDKEKIEISNGKVFVCASELGGVTTTKDLESLKRWITTTSDRVRLAYRHDAEDIPRRFTAIGTTNSAKPLPPDATGNRRWMVIPIPKGAHVEPFIQKRRNLYWRESLALYRLGVKPNLPYELKKEQAKLNIALKRSDDQIEDAFDIALSNGLLGKEPAIMAKIANILNLTDSIHHWISSPKQDQHRLRDVLIGRGWSQKKMRYEGVARQFWVPPNFK